MAKETFYFSHDSNALTDTKILNMRADYGLEGYGLYWAIIEMMRNEEDYKLSLDKNTYRAIKTLTNTEIDIEKYIRDCLDDYELFKEENGKFYSSSLLKRMQKKDEKSAIAREKAYKRWNSNATAIQKQCNINANKVKENKENKNKEKNTFAAPTLDEIKNYISEKGLKVDAQKFYNYFSEGNWVDSKGNKVKNWKQKLLTWNGYMTDAPKRLQQQPNNIYIDQTSQYDNLDKYYVN